MIKDFGQVEYLYFATELSINSNNYTNLTFILTVRKKMHMHILFLNYFKFKAKTMHVVRWYVLCINMLCYWF